MQDEMLDRLNRATFEALGMVGLTICSGCGQPQSNLAPHAACPPKLGPELEAVYYDAPTLSENAQ